MKANVTKVAVIKEVITSITSFIAANLVFSFPVTHLIVFLSIPSKSKIRILKHEQSKFFTRIPLFQSIRKVGREKNRIDECWKYEWLSCK